MFQLDSELRITPALQPSGKEDSGARFEVDATVDQVQVSPLVSQKLVEKLRRQYGFGEVNDPQEIDIKLLLKDLEKTYRGKLAAAEEYRRLAGHAGITSRLGIIYRRFAKRQEDEAEQIKAKVKQLCT